LSPSAAGKRRQATASAGAGPLLAAFPLQSDGSLGCLARWLLFFAALVLLHAPLLRLPYFWDEAGYYIPAARDILLSGDMIPRTTLSNAHPPLVMVWLAACWKLFGYRVIVARLAMLAVSAFALTGLFRLTQRVANVQVAWATVACTALYPVYFSQSSMAHVDLAAASLTLWGLGSWVAHPQRGAKALLSAMAWFALAALAKETAILAAATLFAWEGAALALPRLGAKQVQSVATLFAPIPARLRILRMIALAASVIPLACWFAYHYAATGYIFGNPEFVRYNVTATLQPARILLAMLIRLWQALGYEHLWLLTLLMLFAMRRPALRDDSAARPRVAISTQLFFLAVILAYISAMAVVGGAVLARYMLPVIPLIVLECVSTLWRRVRAWGVVVAAVCASFVLGWFWNPPYEFSPEDNLAYRDFIELQQHAIAQLEQQYPRARVLTAWPASDELTRPWLGYVNEARPVVRIENFTVPEMMLAAGERQDFQTALVFSTKYEPQPLFTALRPEWDRLKERFFDYHRDVDPTAAAAMLQGRVVYAERREGLFACVIDVQPVVLAQDAPHTAAAHPTH
jgi:hypothetical protein